MPTPPRPPARDETRRLRSTRVAGGLTAGVLGALSVLGLYVVAVARPTGRALDESLRELSRAFGRGARRRGNAPRGAARRPRRPSAAAAAG